VGVCYRPPDQEEEVEEAFYRQLKVASQSQDLLGPLQGPTWRNPVGQGSRRQGGSRELVAV